MIVRLKRLPDDRCSHVKVIYTHNDTKKQKLKFLEFGRKGKSQQVDVP